MRTLLFLPILAASLPGQVLAPVLRPAVPAWTVDHLTTYAVYGVSRTRTAHTGALYRVRRDSDSAVLDVYGAPWWPNINTLRTFAGQALLYVTTLYDQSGNSRNCTQPAIQNQPMLDLRTAYPAIYFDGDFMSFDCSANLAAFGQNVAGVSVIAMRRWETVIASATNMPVFFATTNNGNSTRFALSYFSADGKDKSSGRRLDADALVQSTGFAPSSNWGLQIGRWDYSTANLYHDRNIYEPVTPSSEIKTPFLTAGSTSNTASVSVKIGVSADPQFFRGWLAALVLVQSKITDNQTAALVSSFGRMKFPTPALSSSRWAQWGPDYAHIGNYTVATGVTSKTIVAPSGAAPTEGDLPSHRLRHYTKAVYDAANSRFCIAYSSSGTNEDAPGQMSVYTCSTDIISGSAATSTWSTPAVGLGAQNTFSGSGVSYALNSRIGYPRNWQVYPGDGKLYLITALDDINIVGNCEYTPNGVALIATEVLADNSAGTPFRISPASYTAKSGYSEIAYDSNTTRAAALLAYSTLYGNPGGSYPDRAQVSWNNFLRYGNNKYDYLEPVTYPIDGTGLNFERIWRFQCSIQTGVLPLRTKWAQRSSDGGATWTIPAITDIPDQVSNNAAVRLGDGRVLIVGNPRDVQGVGANPRRDPLFLAIFNSDGSMNKVLAIRQGLTGIPTYAGTVKYGGAQYPGIATDGVNLFISYSLAKESIAVSKVPISGL